MSTDDELHIMGTKLNHYIVPWGILAIGVIIGVKPLGWITLGMFLVLLHSNMRTVNTYRGRVDRGERE